MFVSDFKNMLQTLPARELGHSAFIERIQHEDNFYNPATEFFRRVTNYAVNKTQGRFEHYDPRLLLTAFAISRFPIETLGAPEEPLRFTLLAKAFEFLEQIDKVLLGCSNAEDDTADDFLDAETAAEYLHSLNELHSTWIALWHSI